MDDLDRVISEQKRLVDDISDELAGLQRRIESLLATKERESLKLSVLEHAASLRPAIGGRAAAPPARRGKPAGALSGAWRDTLGELYGRGFFAPESVGAAYAKRTGKTLDISSVRDRIRFFAEMEPPLMEGGHDTGFRVTEHAAAKFSFSKSEDVPDNTRADEAEGLASEPAFALAN